MAREDLSSLDSTRTGAELRHDRWMNWGRGTSVALAGDMGEQRRRTALEAARTFERAAREAEISRNYGRAAALYRAALLILAGEFRDDEQTLKDAGCNASVCGEVPQCDRMSHSAGRLPPSTERSHSVAFLHGSPSISCPRASW